MLVIPLLFNSIILQLIKTKLSIYRPPIWTLRSQAAVLIPLCTNAEGQASILFTVRSAHLKAHSSEVAFPGGKRDESDHTAVDTALRETLEEIHVNVAPSGVLGNFITVRSKFGIQVTSVVANIGVCKSATMTFNPDEVAYIFTLTIEELLSSMSQFSNDSPAWPINPALIGGMVGVRIWGLTGYILQQFLREIIIKLPIPAKI